MSFFVILLLAFSSGCKSKKKAMEAAAKQRQLEQQAAEERKKRDEQARLEAEAQAKRDAEAAAARAKDSEPRQRLDGYLNSIANSGNVNAANNSINEALTLFASPQTPVLIVISEENGQKDYDRPTTIIDYLNYLKDQKKNMNKISDVKYDGTGKITELELTKQ